MKKRGIRIFQAGLLAAAIAVPAHIAYGYFTDYEAARGGAVVYLESKTEIIEEVTPPTPTPTPTPETPTPTPETPTPTPEIPPSSAQKRIWIENTGNANSIVRVQISGNYFTSDSITLPAGWTEDGGWYYYNDILPAGETTPEPIIVDIDTTQAAFDMQSFEVNVYSDSSAVSWTYDGTQNTVRLPEGWTGPHITVGV